MGDKGEEEGVKNLKKWVMTFIDGPISTFLNSKNIKILEK